METEKQCSTAVPAFQEAEEKNCKFETSLGNLVSLPPKNLTAATNHFVTEGTAKRNRNALKIKQEISVNW